MYDRTKQEALAVVSVRYLCHFVAARLLVRVLLLHTERQGWENVITRTQDYDFDKDYFMHFALSNTQWFFLGLF